jgi:hypothetical protein
MNDNQTHRTPGVFLKYEDFVVLINFFEAYDQKDWEPAEVQVYHKIQQIKAKLDESYERNRALGRSPRIHRNNLPELATEGRDSE